MQIIGVVAGVGGDCHHLLFLPLIIASPCIPHFFGLVHTWASAYCIPLQTISVLTILNTSHSGQTLYTDVDDLILPTDPLRSAARNLDASSSVHQELHVTRYRWHCSMLETEPELTTTTHDGRLTGERPFPGY